MLDRGDDLAPVIRRRDHDLRVVGLGGEAVREVDVDAGYPVQERRGSGGGDGVPSDVWHPPRSKAPYRPREERETRAALLARAEEELEPDADSADRTLGRDSVAERVVQAVPRQPESGALDVPHPGDQRKRGVANDGGVDGHDGVRTGPDERG